MITLSERDGDVLRNWHDEIMNALLEYKGRYKNMSIEDLHDYLKLIEYLSKGRNRKAIDLFYNIQHAASKRIPRAVRGLVSKVGGDLI